MDRYTKSVLTVIAICLVWISIKDIVIAPLQAEQQMMSWIIGGAQPLKIEGEYRGFDLTKYPRLRELQDKYAWNGSPIPVTVVDECSDK